MTHKLCVDYIFINCPILFVFHSWPVIFGHVRLFYSHNLSTDDRLSPYKSSVQPMYVCYNEQLCAFMLTTVKINGSTCRKFSELISASNYIDVRKDLINIF